MIQFLGSIGFGLVWGWLLAWLTARRPAAHPFLKFLALAAPPFSPLSFHCCSSICGRLSPSCWPWRWPF